MSYVRLPFIKAVAAGNDFIFFAQGTLQSQRIDHAELRAMTPLICRRHVGIGADGVIVLNDFRAPAGRVSWYFLNADGSEAEMCGNAARCVASVLASRGEFRSPVVLETKVGWVELSAHGQDFAVAMPPVTVVQWPLALDLNGKQREEISSMSWLNTGVPHMVIQLKNRPEIASWRPLAAELRRHPHFGPEGANVTLTWGTESRGIFAITFERGVEDFTLACGTGAVAAAYNLARQKDDLGQVDVEMPGGLLRVEFSNELSTAKLIGAAAVVFEGNYLRRTNG